MEGLTAGSSDPPPAAARGTRWGRLRTLAGRELLAFLDLLALTGFVVAQPLLEVLGKSPDFLLFRQADARDIVALAIAITLLPPLALWALEVVVGVAGRRPRQAAHAVLVAGLLGLLGLEAAKKLTPLRGPVLALAGAAVALAGGLLYVRRPVVRLWLRFLYPAPVVFLLAFLLLSPAAELLRPPSAAASTPPAPAAPTVQAGPVVMLLMDEFPLKTLLDHRGRIDRRLYPNFAKLAAASSWYRNATATIGMTGWALPSLFTGRYPAENRLPIASQFPDNLFTLLGNAYHYKMHVFEGMSQLCPPATCPDAKRSSGGTALGGDDGASGDGGGGFRGVLRDSATVFRQIVSTRDVAQDPTATLEEATVDAAGADASADPEGRARIVRGYKRGVNFQRFLTAIRPTRHPERRAMYFVHVLMPHQPWRYLPSGARYPERTLGEGRFAKAGRWVTEPWPVQTIHQRHMLQAAVADRMLGDLVERLRRTGLYDRSLLIVTADHGMAFTPGESGRASVSDSTAPDVLWVPLFVKRPDQRRGAVNDVNWEHVDLVPTIADIEGLRVPWKMDGVSWADPKSAARQRTEKWFDTRPGRRFSFPGPANQAIVLKGATDTLLRPQDGYLGWFKFGPHADLVGRRVSDLQSGPAGGTAQVVGLDEYRHVDPASGTVPAQVGGRLTKLAPGVAARPPVVAAINGVVGGVSETFASPDGTPPTWFTAMIPDSLMHQGDNHLQLFLLDTAGGGQRLRPLALTG
jgi:Sulfatase